MTVETRYLVLALVAVLAVGLVVVGMTVSLRRRRERQAGLDAAFEPLPADLGDPLVVDPVLHVATTRAGDPYERIAAGGLGWRARGTASVHPEGMVLALDGVPPRFVPRDALRGAGRATWTLDRAVEPDGLVLIGWTLGGADVDSYLRADHPDALVEALVGLAPRSLEETP